MAFVEGFRGIFGRVFGGKSSHVVEQVLVWQVAGQIIATLLQPGFNEISRLLNSEFQTVPLTPAQLADMVIRNVLPLGPATEIAKQSGVAPSDFLSMVRVTGNAPGPADLAEALRRGIIPEAGGGPDAISFEQGIREGNLKDKWTPIIKALAVQEPSPVEPLEALLEGQLAEGTARELYARFGGDLEHFQWRFNSRGQAPTPSELLELANRRIIPWDGEGPEQTSFHQGFLEGPWRNKWEPAFRELGRHLPPPRTVVALVRSGALDDQAAAQYLQDSGLSPELAAAYITEAHHSKTKPERDLTVGQILDLYEGRALGAADTSGLLRDMGYSDSEAGQLIAVRDLRRAARAFNAAVSRIGNLYIARKIDRSAAVAALGGLQVPSAQVTELLTVWDQERAVTVKVLTPAEVVAAFHWKIFDQQTATQELVDQGYTAYDAWAMLSIREHTPLPSRPPR